MKDALPVLSATESPPYTVVPVREQRLPHLAPGDVVSVAYVQTLHRSETSTQPDQSISFHGPHEHATARSNARATLLATVKEFSTGLHTVRSDMTDVARSMAGMSGEQLSRLLGLVRAHLGSMRLPNNSDDLGDLLGDAPAPDDAGDQGEGYSEEVSQLIQTIVDKCTSRQPRRQEDKKSALSKELERASSSSTPHHSVLQILADQHDICSHGIEMFFEILPRGDAGSLATDSRKGAAERIWVFVTCPESTFHRINLDDALDRIVARNNAPPPGRFSKGPQALAPTGPICAFTSSLKALHPDLTERLYLPYHERREGVALSILQAIHARAFVDKRGKALAKLSDSALRAAYPDIGLDALFGRDAIAREPIAGNSAQHTVQMEPYVYIRGLHPNAFPDNYVEQCTELHREQTATVARARAMLVRMRQQHYALMDRLQGLELREAHEEPPSLDEESCIRAQLENVERETSRLNAKIRAAHEPLQELTASTWERLDCKWFSKGITLEYLPLQVQSDCFWQVANLTGMLPSSVYSSFIGHWERLQQLRCRRSEANSCFRTGVTGGVAVTLTDADASNLVPFDQMPEILRKQSYSTRIVKNYMHTTLHEFTEEHLPALQSWLAQRERVLAGKAPVDSLPGWWTRLRHFAADLVNNVAHQPETDANFGEAVRAGAPLDDKLHLFGTARLQPLQECACRQDPTIEAGDEAVQYIMSTAASGLNLGFTQLPFLVLNLVTLDSCICRADRIKTHFIGSGNADAGKSHLLGLVRRMSLPGLFASGSKESACAAYSDSASDSGLVGCKVYDEAPKTIKNYKPGKEGAKECDELDERKKQELSEGTRDYERAGLGKNPNGHTEIITTRTSKWAKWANIIMTNDPQSSISPEILSRCIFWVIDNITSTKKSPANFKVSENAEGGVGISGSEANNKDVYVQRFQEFTQRTQLLALVHGAMRIFAPGVLPPHTGAMNHVYGAFEHVLRTMGSQKRPTRKVSQAMSIAEALMQTRIYYEDSRRHGALGANTLGTHVEKYYSKRRTSELRQVLSISDCVKAVGLVLADDRIHDVLRVLDAVAAMLEAGKYGFAELFMEPAMGMNAPPVFTTDCLRFMRFKKHVQSGEHTLSSFAKLLVPFASGMNPDRVLRTLRELERSHSLSDYGHAPMDMNMGDENGRVWTALDADDVRQSNVGIFDKMNSAGNFDRRGCAWRELRKNPVTAAHALYLLPYEHPPRIGDRPMVTPFVSVDSYKGEVRIATAAFVDRLNGKLNQGSGVLKRMCDRLSDSTTTSRYVGFTPSGMSALDPAAPQLLELTYLRHRADHHEVSLNPQFVSDSMHEWMAPGAHMPTMCMDITGVLRPNIPLDLQFALQHIARASEIDHDVFPGVHQAFDSDPLGFLIMAPHWAREIIDKVGDTEAARLWAPGSTRKGRRDLIRSHLAAPASAGGYRDFFRHICPHTHRDMDPDHELDADGTPENKMVFLRFLERATADLERCMSLPDEATLPEMNIPQTDAARALKREIAALHAQPAGGEARRGATSSVALKLQALHAQLAMVEQDRTRIMSNIRVGRHTAVPRPCPFAWVETRERLADRPGVHSGAGYSLFVRDWAKTMTERRKARWGRLVDGE